MAHKKREGIVALTQTEIMLVLAVVILLLLAAKNADLTHARVKIAEQAQRLEHLGETTDGAAEQPAGEESAAAAPQTASELDAEITEPLIPGGAPVQPPQPLGAENAALPLPEKTDGEILEELTTENARLLNENTVLKNEIAALQSAAPPVQKELPAAVSDGESNAESPENSAAANKPEIADNLRKEIGCLPCWLGGGAPRYYSTYNITYTGGRYQIAPHKHLQSGAKVVQQALAGELAAVNNYPKNPVGAREFLAFSKTIAAAKKRRYGENGCKLAVTINEEATGKIIKFIRDEAGFCPILR